MLKSHEKFHSANGKRLVLVVDDEYINRELLTLALSQDYETITASNGEEALRLIRAHSDTLSLVLLDLLMPGMHGLDLLRIIKTDPEISHIPVIVLTADQEAEVTSLKNGASDFIPKPYPKQQVILTRVLRTIELSEDREIIQSTERDSLTGLYNREYFYRYAEQFDQHHRDMDMDAIVVDVHHFHMINERYGKAYGDEVLRRIGERVREMVRDSDGIVCRREGDTFLVYCPHREDYAAILESASVGLAGEGAAQNRVRLRMGVYASVDKAIDIERRFDRAKMAADTLRNNFAKSIALYDSALHESEIYAEQLLEDFQTALSQRQFVVYYQPKFDIRPEIPVLASAEALVRWQHPRLGLISPGVFIPLFEENGLIQSLDLYVWREACAQIRDWKERLGISVPVSVNVSRVDMYDPNLIDTFQLLLAEYRLQPHELLLEITESAYTQDSAQIISTVNRLRSLGFHIEMDDFGTGYSSLNMISSLPIDALKLDMKFIRNAFRDGRDTRMIEVIIDIADYLGVPVIAEGVETEEQLHALKAMGCDLVQGYYFSKPVPPGECERFVEERRRQISDGTVQTAASIMPELRESGGSMSTAIAHALTSGFESIYYVDTRSGQYVQFSSQGRYEALQIERSGADFFGDTQRNIPRVVMPEDQQRVSLSLQREALMHQLLGGRTFSMTYRLLIGGEPMYYNLRAVNANARDDHHIVIGVSNVHEQIRQASDEAATPRGAEFHSIAQALSSDFESIYYVDMETDRYTEFTAQGSYEDLQIELTGERFFDECQRNLLTVVYGEDQPKVSAALSKRALSEALERDGSFSLLYRLLIDGEPVYYQLKAVRAEEGGRFIVIGVSNMANQMAREMAYDAMQRDSMTYARIAQALSQDYFTIYYVDTETERFMEYSTRGADRRLTLERVGEGFFEDCKRSISERVVPEDRQRALEAFEKEKLLKAVEGGKTFSISYRLKLGETPIYANLKVLHLSEDEKHIVIGISNVEAQMQQQAEYEKTKREIVTFASIAQALAADYFSIYYVDTVTDRFVEYSAHDDYEALGIEKGGDDFFNLSRRNILRVVHPEDHEKILASFTKEKLLNEIRRTGTFTLNYRLMFDGEPTYVSMKATRMADEDDAHIVIGVNNIDAQMRRQQAYDAARAQSITYSRIAQALAKDYYSIYLVDAETDEFVEYSSSSDYQELQVEQSGKNFFEDCRRNVMRLVYKEDLGKALTVWDKSRLMPELERGEAFSTTYRLVIDGEPVYINCKVILTNDEQDGRHIIIGISNVDAQMRRERELDIAREKANRDALTGVKSKHAYAERENEVNEGIAAGTEKGFSIVVCDVNGLKTINDTLGHAAGDRLIKDAAMEICNIFVHSPVFRYGGDEFVVLLRGQDYERRDALMEILSTRNAENEGCGGVIIASGIADFAPGVDECMAQVFSRADAVMYENKKRLKGARPEVPPGEREET